MILCNKCGQLKPASEFYENKNSRPRAKSTVRKPCIQCMLDYRKKYRETKDQKQLMRDYRRARLGRKLALHTMLTRLVKALENAGIHKHGYQVLDANRKLVEEANQLIRREGFTIERSVRGLKGATKK